MEKEKLESLLIDYIDGRLSEADRLSVEHELSGSEEAKQLHVQLLEVMSAIDKSRPLEPGIRLKASFNQMLREEINKNRPTKSLFFQSITYRIAAGIVFVLASIGIGYWINKNNEREAEIASLRKEVEATKQMMLTMLDNQQSASQRMVGTAVAYKIDKADDEIVTALVKVMNEDHNTNVRLAALEALLRFHEDPRVRKELIAALSTQSDPVVQITLIKYLVKMKEKEVVRKLEDIVNDARTIKAVRDEAYTGLLKLS